MKEVQRCHQRKEIKEREREREDLFFPKETTNKQKRRNPQKILTRCFLLFVSFDNHYYDSYEGLVDIYGQCEHLGVMSFEDGDRYEGGFNQGAMSGPGIYHATASYFWANLKEIKSLGAV